MKQFVHKNKSQASLEFMVGAGLLLVILLGTLAISAYIREEIRLYDVRQTLKTECYRITDLMTAASSAGPGSMFQDKITHNLTVLADSRMLIVSIPEENENVIAQCGFSFQNVTNGYSSSFIIPHDVTIWAVNNNGRIELREAALQDHLIFLLPLDEIQNANTTTQDSSMYHRILSINASAVSCNKPGYLDNVTAVRKSCLFNNTNYAVKMELPEGLSSTVNLTKDFTLSAWIKRTGNSPNFAEIFVSRWGGLSSNSHFSFGLVNLHPNNRSLRVILSNSTGGYIEHKSGLYTHISNDVWTHVMVVKDSTKVYFYINGTDVTNLSDNTVYDSMFTSSTYPLKIGNEAYDNFPFPGYIDDVRIYDRALSKDEANRLYKSYFSLNPSRMSEVPQ